VPISRVEPRWLTAEDVIEINKDEVAETGEPFVLMDEGKLLGALSRPRMRWNYDETDDMVVLASALLFSIAQSHAFAQGNKRTGFTAAAVFLELNGYSLNLGDDEETQESFGALIVDIIERRADLEDFVFLIRFYVEPHDPG
jgi:death-on-curing protein